MSPEQTACEGTTDLKAFERRLTEVIACLQPATYRWRSKFWRLFGKSLYLLLIMCVVLLLVVSICVATGAGQWLMDPTTRIVPLTQSLSNHPFFIISTMLLGIIFLMGVHKRVIAASIITSRTREVLCDFNMSCDDTGKLILKPRPMNIT